MLKVFFGPDTAKARAALMAEIAKFRDRYPNAPVSRFDADHCDPQEVAGAIGSASLFGDPACVVLDGLFERAEGTETFLPLLSEAAKNANSVLLFESAPKAEIKKSLLVLVDKKDIKEFAKTEKREDGAVFALGDTLGAKDKRKFWELYVRLRRDGHAPEEIHGTLWWAAKSLYIAKTCSRTEAEEAGVKGYSYTKYADFAKKWTEDEMRHVLDRLKDMPHERDVAELQVQLEQFALTLY